MATLAKAGRETTDVTPIGTAIHLDKAGLPAGDHATALRQQVAFTRTPGTYVAAGKASVAA